MIRRSRPFLALFSVAVLTLVFTLLFSGGEGARALFQVSPIGSPTSNVPTPPPVTEEPFATLEPPTSVPLPPTQGPTATPLGFLPAPTIVNPNDIKSLPLAQPPSSGGLDASEPTPAPTAPPQSTARAAVALLNSLWLLCGSVLLIGGAVAIFLIWRRGHKP